jgi:hypothetical protein
LENDIMPDESHEQSGGTEAAARRLNVGDALILVAALGLGISGIRERIQTFSQRAVAWRQEYTRFRNDLASVPAISQDEADFAFRSLVVQVSDECQAWFLSMLVGLTPAQILMRLRRPRPEWRSLLRQPGFMACSAALIGYLIDQGWDRSIQLGFARFPFWTSLAPLIVWAILLLLRRCRAEKSWIDRLGRVLGACWIVAGFWSQLEQYYFW